MVTIGSAPGVSVNCGFAPVTGSGPHEALSYGTNRGGGSFSTSTGSALVDTRTTPVVLRCHSFGGTVSVDPGGAISSISMLRVDTVHDAAGTSARVKAPSSRSVSP